MNGYNPYCGMDLWNGKAPERNRIPYCNPFRMYPHKEVPTNPFQNWKPNYQPQKISAIPSIDNAIY